MLAAVWENKWGRRKRACGHWAAYNPALKNFFLEVVIHGFRQWQSCKWRRARPPASRRVDHATQGWQRRWQFLPDALRASRHDYRGNGVSCPRPDDYPRQHQPP